MSDADIDAIIDDFQKRLSEIPTWTKAKRQIVGALRDALAEAGYVNFETSSSNCFSLTGLGNDTVQTIPPKKRGVLGRWQGQTIRIVCIGSGRYRRGYAAGPTTRSPS